MSQASTERIGSGGYGPIPTGEITIENGFRYILAIEEAVAQGVRNAPKEERLGILACYGHAFKTSVGTMQRIRQDLESENEAQV